MAVSPNDRLDMVRSLKNTLLQSNSSAELEGLENFEAKLCKDFDEIVTRSTSMAATYHAMSQEHAAWEKLIKKLAALPISNIVGHQVQLLRNHKARLEQAMVDLEDAQCPIWEETQELHSIHKEVLEIIEISKKLRKANNGTPNPEINGMEGDSGSGPSQAK